MTYALWIFELLSGFLHSTFDVAVDAFIYIAQMVFNVLVSVIGAIPVPAFMASGGLQTLINGIPPDVWFFAHNLQLGPCLAMFGAAATFRLGRKLATAFQW